MYLLSMGLQFVVNYWGHKLGINIETDMRRQLFNHVQKLVPFLRQYEDRADHVAG